VYDLNLDRCPPQIDYDEPIIQKIDPWNVHLTGFLSYC
jgi:hypothetical protein